MSKIQIREGDDEEMAMISEFLLERGFTPVYGLEASKREDDPFGVHDMGRGWRSFKGDRRWMCQEPIPAELIENSFELPVTVRVCYLRGIPEAGVSLASDVSYETITSEAITARMADPGTVFEIGSKSSH